MKPNLLTPGELAPEFEIRDLHGNSVRLSDFHSKQPVVLAFLRGFM
jgi:peroxiredoxin